MTTHSGNPGLDAELAYRHEQLTALRGTGRRPVRWPRRRGSGR